MLFVLLLVLFVFLSSSASRRESATIDEFRHLSTGVYNWQSGDYSFDAATPPLWKMAMALPAYLDGAKQVRFNPLPEIAGGWEPWFVATDFMRDNGLRYEGFLQKARWVNIMAGVACLALLYVRCRKSFGAWAALYGSAFLALSPTFLAHSHYATTDIIATLTLMATVLLLLDHLERPVLVRAAGIAIAFSLALLCKYTALLLAPLLVLVPLAFFRKGSAKKGPLPMQVSSAVLLVVLIPLLVINGFYGFRGTGTPLKAMSLQSRSLTELAGGIAGSLPVPLPKAYVQGFDKQKADSDYSEFPAYLMGQWSADGFRSYYLAAFCLKESLPFLLIVAAALSLMVLRRGGPQSPPALVLLCYLPVVLFLVLSFMNRLNVGVRYLLPAYPFFCLFIAQFYCEMARRHVVRLVLVLLFVLHSVSVLRITPNFTSYFNEAAGGPENGYRFLIDSNVDWGQDLPSLKEFMTVHGIAKIQLAYFGHGLPEHYGIDYEPLSRPAKPGYAAVSVSLLQGHPYLLTYTDPPSIAEAGQFRFLQDLKPIGRAGYSLLIYRLPPQP